ncbi:MAG TPA: SET domain-containing protein-lysine N-methyltransferase [Longimicrobiales bacterium]|nr:SET domain-containing protein-lysine N-methyltransferase [Longimicrobiales bacterium]
MRIALLTYDYTELDSPLGENEVKCDPRPFAPDAEWVEIELEKATAVHTILGLPRDRHDLFFNFCDGAWDSDAPGIDVVRALERLDVPFTGADSRFFDPSREAMKRVCAAWGIDTPGYVMAGTDADLERAADTLRFPLIVKHPGSYSSIGLTRRSRVEDFPALQEQAGITMGLYGSALIEEFIDGGEATVLVAETPGRREEPTTYTPIGYRFPKGETFKHYDLKWISYHGLEGTPVADPELEERLRDISARMFRGLHGTGYARCDIRVDRDGRPIMLEINPNCGIYYPLSDPGSADLCLAHDPAGHEGFTSQIIDAAFQRPRRPRQCWEIRADRTLDYGHYATRDIRAGERIVPFEERPHVLVTRSHVEAHWGEPDRGWFGQYAWPLTDEVWVIWASDPEEWRPINHSCDPSAWLDGLDVVARRIISAGEQITLDYATFANEVMPPFHCRCGAAECRGVIRGDDYLQDFVARYGEHVSDYVRQRRAAAADLSWTKAIARRRAAP